MRSCHAPLLAALCLVLMEQRSFMVSAFSTSKKLQGFAGRHLQQPQSSSTTITTSKTQQPTLVSIGFVGFGRTPSLVVMSSASTTTTTTTTNTAGGSFIETQLRGAAMRLHTKQQAPKEGQVEVKEETSVEPYTPTRDDYLAFLVDSKHVYEAFEEIVASNEAMAPFRNTGLERTKALETDIAFMVHEYGLEQPPVGDHGKSYAALLREIAARNAIPELMCHYYNFYFAHTAGGRMIGKQMSALLLDKKTLEFYKWDGDLNEIKARVKENIEKMAAAWSQEEKDECVAATPNAFRYGGMINSYLSGGRKAH